MGEGPTAWASRRVERVEGGAQKHLNAVSFVTRSLIASFRYFAEVFNYFAERTPGSYIEKQEYMQRGECMTSVRFLYVGSTVLQVSVRS